MAKPTQSDAEDTQAVETPSNGEREPQAGGSPLTIVRAKISGTIEKRFRTMAENAGVEYGVLLEMAVTDILGWDNRDLKEMYNQVMSERSENLFK